MTTDRSFIRIVRKLEQAELAHLRTLCADLQARLDAAELAEIERLDRMNSPEAGD